MTTTMSRTTVPDQARAPPRTKRELFVRNATLQRGVNLTDLAEKIGVTPQGLHAMLRAPKPRNETIAKLVAGLRAIGAKVTITDLV